MAVNSGRDTGQAAGDFGSLYRHGFARVAVAIPRVTVADPASNAEQIIALARQAAGEHAVLTVFPELSLSSYTADDLFHQDALHDAVLDALRDLVAASSGLGTAVVVGAPLRADGLLSNCAVVVCEGTVRGVVPKSYLPNYREFYEKRYFAAARDTAARQISLFGQDVAFGPDLLFDAEGLDDFSFHVEICEDLWVPVPASPPRIWRGTATHWSMRTASSSPGEHVSRPPPNWSPPISTCSGWRRTGCG